MITRVTVFTVVFILSSSFILADDPCRFENVRGVIDLTSVGRPDGSPAYTNRRPPVGPDYEYSYNPCKSYNQGVSCQNVAACQSSYDGIFSYALGTQESAQWSAGAGLGSGPSISYSSGEKRLIVLLECSESGVDMLEALGEDFTNNFKYRLTHKCACWNGCGGGPPPPPTTTKSSGGGGGGGGGGVSGGTVFVILLIVLVFVYFAGFAVFYRFRHQRSGTELIPHRTFWVGLPGYVRDGAVYTYRRVANKGGDPYQSV